MQWGQFTVWQHIIWLVLSVLWCGVAGWVVLNISQDYNFFHLFWRPVVISFFEESYSSLRKSGTTCCRTQCTSADWIIFSNTAVRTSDLAYMRNVLYCLMFILTALKTSNFVIFFFFHNQAECEENSRVLFLKTGVFCGTGNESRIVHTKRKETNCVYGAQSCHCHLASAPYSFIFPS